MPKVITLPVEVAESAVQAAARGRVRQWVGPEIAEDVVRAVLSDVLGAGGQQSHTAPEESKRTATLEDGEAATMLMRKYLGVDPATVSIRRVRAELGGARHDRAVRVKGLWAARYDVAFRHSGA